MITVTQRDALKSEVVQPGVYLGECVAYQQGSAKDASLLHQFEVEIDAKGVRIPLKVFQISEKAISMGKAFFIACGFPQEEWDKLIKGESQSVQINPNDCVNKKFRVQVINTTFNNRVSSEAGDFFKL